MWWRRGLMAVAGLLVLIQLWPVGRSNPPVEQEIPAPPEIRAVLERACYDCHSNTTDWPWYAYVAPVSWRVAGHVHDGRRHLNFSTWNRYDDKKKRHRVSDILEEVVMGEMPLPDYLRLHPDAVVAPHEIALIRDWVADYRPENERAPTASAAGSPGGAPGAE